MSQRIAAKHLARLLGNAGHIAYFAGGCVRDKLLGLEPKDYDIATSATPAEILKLFPRSNEVGAHFGVIITKHEGYYIEIATFRTDGSYKDGRRPDSVTFSTPENDAQRRDFTINGLFEDPESGEVIDYVNGLPDLETRTLRAIGNPASRFQEDALRLLRAVRFSTTLGFPLESETLAAIRGNSHLLGKISMERIRDEFSKIITHPNRRFGIELLVETGLIQYFLPEAIPLIGCEQPPQWHPEGDVYTHTCIMLEMLDPDASLTLCLATLLHDIAKPPTQTVDPDGRIRFNGHDSLGAEMAEEILSRLKYPNVVIRDAAHMVSRHMQFMNVQQMREAKLKRFMSVPTFDQEMELHRVDCASSNGFTDNYTFLNGKAEEFAREPLIPPPLVSGHDLIKKGVPPSPRFKEILDEIQTEQLEKRLNTREEALAYLEKILD
ncbi:CCA tRNA nucleotidyltransferase [Luteolibacter sp. AS25]|uniref:CCA tRNA nucleotidyltransferase n=1 Tax=Luteolibacter sp. AS25 TaxID=3135776 RepID=UPI00398BAF01